ncbi:MAG: hypothetical protein R8M71_01640 [Alphaproteobacteria bacterium]|nr:hypothetical protein [Alphaproteobacteria bacterium]
MNQDKVVLEKADKAAIAVAVVAFLTFSVLLYKHQQNAHVQQTQKTEQAVKKTQTCNAKTINFESQKTR